MKHSRGVGEGVVVMCGYRERKRVRSGRSDKANLYNNK